tara:strand:+ start:800 stop:988 length:189 start_codon:yes stop_codon:yes gene_type:complete
MGKRLVDVILLAAHSPVLLLPALIVTVAEAVALALIVIVDAPVSILEIVVPLGIPGPASDIP